MYQLLNQYQVQVSFSPLSPLPQEISLTSDNTSLIEEIDLSFEKEVILQSKAERERIEREKTKHETYLLKKQNRLKEYSTKPQHPLQTAKAPLTLLDEFAPQKFVTPIRRETPQTTSPQVSSQREFLMHIMARQQQESHLQNEAILLATQLFGQSNQSLIQEFARDYQSLVELGYPSARVKQAMLLFRSDPSNEKRIDYLVACECLLQEYPNQEVQEALNTFNQNVQVAKAYLNGFRTLLEFGFPKGDIKAALLMSNNDPHLALQHLL